MYNLNFPGRIIFGTGAFERVPKELAGCRRILAVGCRSALAAGWFDRLSGVPTATETPLLVSGEPTLDEVDHLREVGRNSGADAVLAIGGGSVIDAAKAAAALLRETLPTRAFFYEEAAVSGPGVPLIALPTTAGTGAEITANAVLTDPASGIKQSLRGPHMFAKCAIVDPELTYSCPPAVTAASGMDALTQGIESYLSKRGNPVSRALANTAVKLMLPALEAACVHGTPEARSAMAEGSMIAAMAFAQSGLGAVHGLAHPLGSLLHVGHGSCCATLLAPVLHLNAAVAQRRMDELAPDLIGKVEDLRARLGIPSDFAAAGLTPEHDEIILRQCRSGSMQCNPRDLSDDDIRTLLENLR